MLDPVRTPTTPLLSGVPQDLRSRAAPPDMAPQRPEPDMMGTSTSVFLSQCALAVARIPALGALEGWTFGPDGACAWTDPAAFPERLEALYLLPEAEPLRFVRVAWQATVSEGQPPGVGAEAADHLHPQRLALTEFGCSGMVTFQPGAGAEPRHTDLEAADTILGELLSLARHWLRSHPFSDGLPTYPVNSVARCTEFAYLFLDAVARARPGERLDLPDMDDTEQHRRAAQASELRRRAALGLNGQGEFLALSARQRQAMGELLLLRPTFYAAMYEYARVADDADAEDMCIELANDELSTLFGQPPYRTGFTSLTLLPGPIGPEKWG